MEAVEQEKDQEVIKGFKSHIPLIVVVIIVGVLIWFWHKEYSRYIRTDDAYIDSDMAGIAPKIVGRIAKIYYQENDSVKKGALLVELDSTELKARQNETKVLIQQSMVSVKAAEAEYNLSKDNISLLEINLRNAKTDFDRAKIQFEGKVIPLENYEHIQKNYESAQARYSAAEKQTNLAESQITVASAQLEKSKAQYKYIRTQLANTRLYAPFNGMLAKRWLLPGDVVMPGQSIYSLVNDKVYWVSVFLEENYLSSLKVGSRASIEVDAFHDIIFKGRVFYIASNSALEFSINPPNNAAGNYTKIAQRFNLKISLDTAFDKDNKVRSIKLLPGMSAEVKILK